VVDVAMVGLQHARWCWKVYDGDFWRRAIKFRESSSLYIIRKR